MFDTPTLYASLESERWTLDGSRALHPGMPNITGENGFVGAVLSQDDKTFAVRPWVQLNVHNLGIMQACSVYFRKTNVTASVRTYDRGHERRYRRLSGNGYR